MWGISVHNSNSNSERAIDKDELPGQPGLCDKFPRSVCTPQVESASFAANTPHAFHNSSLRKLTLSVNPIGAVARRFTPGGNIPISLADFTLPPFTVTNCTGECNSFQGVLLAKYWILISGTPSLAIDCRVRKVLSNFYASLASPQELLANIDKHIRNIGDFAFISSPYFSDGNKNLFLSRSWSVWMLI